MKNLHMPRTFFLAAAVTAAAWAMSAPALAQEDAGASTGLVADPNSAVSEDILSQLTPEELERLVRKADTLRLADERQRVIDEISAGSLWAEDAKDAAAKLLEEKADNTMADNIDRVCKAFAKVDPPFRKACQLFADARFKEAAESAQQLLKEDEDGFGMAAKYFLRAQSLEKFSAALAEGNSPKESREILFDAIEAYKNLVELMPERISFAAVSGLKAGKMYEDAGRNINAMKVYAVVLRNYSISLTAAERQALLDKLDQWMEIYKDPKAVLKHVAGKMGEVEKRLADKDSGKDTQDQERQIVQVMEDLIKTIEECQQAQCKNPNSGQEKDKKKGDGESECKGEGKGQCKTGGPPKGTNQPSSPARSTFLPGGETVRPGRLEDVHRTDEKGDWAELPPSERDKLVEVMKKHMSERMDRLTREYSTALSDAEKKAK
jgi:tetratricopeptide (TPR) repeat protein